MSATNPTARLQCRCATVQGTVNDASPARVNRVICYCDDCQAFARFLDRLDLLDSSGGSDIVQIAAGCLKIEQGEEAIRGVRLSEAGTYRWYSSCCNTPLANMGGVDFPALGIHSTAFGGGGQNLDALFGCPIGGIRGEYAIGGAPPGSNGLPLRLILRAIPKVVLWRFGSKGKPNPFVSHPSKDVRYPVATLSEIEQSAL